MRGSEDLPNCKILTTTTTTITELLCISSFCRRNSWLLWIFQIFILGSNI
ncbi:unnamed protein product, partial [Arabidopsis halleri]